jgi:hypothetical protein
MRLAAAIAFVLATVLGAMQGRALIRAALVIDDAGDQNAHVLPNPINDARDIAEFKTEGQLQGMRSMPRDRGGAGGQLHHGLAG